MISQIDKVFVWQCKLKSTHHRQSTTAEIKYANHIEPRLNAG
ncbi:hypothetical protein SAMN03159507_00588 [Pseudomonas sp. NFACC32-1]|nr:hypothetical protein SAMN03159507_00588 [Pseudomonas sp. NFACC32-1]SFW65807.1 hypothetical protein SAMN03159376_02730 [Pseudomonas sp. NFACC09-4]SFX07761.1 hypothetical protein SAMN03159352_00199 [Pseudomonas sp. NFACC43]SFX12822.1 hypothetical protein SAMN03159442_00598 [Pseudomonas sp. NFACC47-1]SFX30021.1 hypothetical protein SAMN03159390_00971 [Pseudomonas sp. NFACC49-2]SFX56022.1 hypothetical protein SAMN03159309_01924 [Pseudomonas sp. NFACC36]SIS26785.1 hypothetical protein SAMN05428